MTTTRQPVGSTEPRQRSQPPEPGHPTPLRHPWSLVARREIATKLVDRTFLLGTFVTIAIITGFVVVQAVMASRGSDYRLVATSGDVAMARSVADRAPALDDKVRVEVETVPDQSAARAALDEETADVWLVSGDGGWLLVGRDEVPGDVEDVAATVVREETLAANARAAGTTVEVLTRGSVLGTEVLVGDPEQRGFADGMAFALAFLFYLASVGFGTALAGSVVEEKQSRIVEIIATKIPVRQLLAGKVLGNTALAVLQMALYGVIGVVGLNFTSYGALLPTVTDALGWFLVFFLVGFLLIACLWAVAGALASRNEDLQSTSMPITLVLLGIFFGSLLLDGPAQTVLSYVPPASAVLMPLRVLDGSAAWWEPFVSLAILLASAAAVVLVAERLYRRSLLQTQGRLSVRQAWSAPE